jgi:hypothetical protein
VSAAVTEATATTAATAGELEVVLAFSSVEDYQAMGEHIAAVRGRLDLPAWATPTEVIAAALKAAL